MAGYALRSLTGDDAREADRLLSEHVPGCVDCRQTLLAFTDAVADLAFAADPLAPPETLLPALHREMEPRRGPSFGPRWAGIAAAAAVFVIVGGLALSQGMRAGDLEEQADLFAQALALSQRPDAKNASLVDAAAEVTSPVSEVSAPGVGHFFLVGRNVPPPPGGTLYGIWLSNGVDAVFVGSFAPEPDLTVVRVPFDRSRFDRVLITLETPGATPAAPGRTVWEAGA